MDGHQKREEYYFTRELPTMTAGENLTTPNNAMLTAKVKIRIYEAFIFGALNCTSEIWMFDFTVSLFRSLVLNVGCTSHIGAISSVFLSRESV